MYVALEKETILQFSEEEFSFARFVWMMFGIKNEND